MLSRKLSNHDGGILLPLELLSLMQRIEVIAGWLAQLNVDP